MRHALMEQDECKKLLPLVNPKLYKSTMNKERQKQREEEKAEKEQQDSLSLVAVESPIEAKAEPVINEIPEPEVDSEILSAHDVGSYFYLPIS